MIFDLERPFSNDEDVSNETRHQARAATWAAIKRMIEGLLGELCDAGVVVLVPGENCQVCARVLICGRGGSRGYTNCWLFLVPWCILGLKGATPTTGFPSYQGAFCSWCRVA